MRRRFKGSTVLKACRQRASLARDERGAVDISSVLTGIIIFAIVGAVVGGVYFGIINSSKDTSPKASAQTAQTMVDACYVNAQSYGNCTTQAQLENGSSSGVSWGTGAANSGTVKVVSTGASNTGYTISAAGTSNGTVYTITKDPASGAITRTCAPVSTGGCASTGSW
jgi:type II secretory pathway pseudopilin PulG